MNKVQAERSKVLRSLHFVCGVLYALIDCMLSGASLVGNAHYEIWLGKGRTLTHGDYGSVAEHPFIEY